jgi:AcrR family transcriptional regulator
MADLQTLETANDQTLSTQDWIDAAKRMLIHDGVGALKVDRLAKACNVTRGGFYWRFKSREDLLDKLLDEWKQANTAPFLDVLNSSEPASVRLQAAVLLWLREDQFDPAFDAAVRAWATSSPKAAAVVREIDQVRIEAFHRVFLDAGYRDAEALVRARVMYFQQVGYYALGIHDPSERRLDLLEHYYRLLTGLEWTGARP